MTVQRLVRRLQPTLGEEYAEAGKVLQQAFWAKLMAGNPAAL